MYYLYSYDMDINALQVTSQVGISIHISLHMGGL